jgi:Family of unknown function (DUF5906)
MNEASRLREDEGLVGAYVELILGGVDEAEIGALWDELVRAKGREFAGRVEAAVMRRDALLREQTSNKTEAGRGSRKAAAPAVGPETIEASLGAQSSPAVGAGLEEAIGRAEPDVEPPSAAPKPSTLMLPTAPEAEGPAVVPHAVQPLADVLAALNSANAIIDNYGGKTCILSVGPSSLDPTKKAYAFQTKSDFLLRFSNRFVEVQEWNKKKSCYEMVATPLGPWWLSHPKRAQFGGITFLPGAERVLHGCLNLYRGWDIEANEGDWGLIRQHIEEVVASGSKGIADYVLRWIAWAIQNPDKQAEVALVLIGDKGWGKGTVARALERIFGDHAIQVNSKEHIVDKFNGHLQDMVLLIADEAYWGGDKRCIARLQGMITEPTLSIERKGFDVVQVRNFLHIVMLAEPGWVIPAGRFERRYAAIEVSNKRHRDKKYFDAPHKSINGDGAAAMLWELGRMALGDWHPRNIPDELLKGDALRKQQQYNLPPREQWLLSVLHDGRMPWSLG